MHGGVENTIHVSVRERCIQPEKLPTCRSEKIVKDYRHKVTIITRNPTWRAGNGIASLGFSLLRNRGLAAKDALLDLAGGLFSADRPIGDVKSLKALHRYKVVKTPAVGVITVLEMTGRLLRRQMR
jgi:hypothetical protein